jgi:hypothetical protein
MIGSKLLRRRLVLHRRLLREGCSAQQAVLYLMQVQRDETELAVIANRGEPTADTIDPALLRLRALHYRELADKADGPQLASLCRELDDGFEREAEAQDK